MITANLEEMNRLELLEFIYGQDKLMEALQFELKKEKELGARTALELDSLRSDYSQAMDELTKVRSDMQNESFADKEADLIKNAAANLSQLFDTAQRVSNEYLDQVKGLIIRQTEIMEKRDCESRLEAEYIIARTKEKCELLEKEMEKKYQRTLEEAEERAKLLESVTIEKCKNMLRSASEKNDELNARIENEWSSIDHELRQRKEQKIKETRSLCHAMVKEAREESEAYWKEVTDRLEIFYDEHKGLREMVRYFDPDLPKPRL